MRYLLRVLLLAVATAAALVVLELALTAWYGDLGVHGNDGIVEEFDSPFIFKVRLDPFAHEIVAPRSEAAAEADRGSRVLVYRDGVVGGPEQKMVPSYVQLLGERFATGDHEAIRVLDMVRGFSPTTYSFNIRLDVPRMAPDGVVMQIELLNDVSDEAMLRTTGRKDNVFGFPLEIHRSRYTLGWDGSVLSPLSVSGSFVERTKVYAKISTLVGRVMNRVVPNPVFGPDSRTRFYSQPSERWLLTVGALGAGFDRLFDSVVAVQSFLESQDVEFLLVILPSRDVYTGDRFSESALSMLKRAEARAQEKKVATLSTWQAIGKAGGARLFQNPYRLTAEGNEVVADLLEPIVAQW